MNDTQHYQDAVMPNQWDIPTFDDGDTSSKLPTNPKRRALIDEIVNDGVM